jgi:PAS domain S-box-containing protein
MKTVLVVDGSGHDLDALQKLLRDHGYAASAMSQRAWQEKAAEQCLEKRYRSIFENAPIGMFRSSFDGKLLSANPAAARMYKYGSPEEMLEAVNRTSIAEVLYLDPGHRQKLLERVQRCHGWVVIEEQYRCKDGSINDCYFHLRAVPGPDGKPCELEGFIEDITERKRTERALQLTQFAIDKTIDQAFWVAPDGRFSYVNEAACAALGYSREELIGMAVPDIDPLFSPENWARHWRELKEKGVICFESQHRARDGRVFPVEVRANYVAFDDKEYNCAFVTDISERKEAEVQIRASLAEKEVLLKEIHHRVKNNLQVVSSLLFLQAQKIEDPELAAHFTESQNRVYSMALAHEQLYQSKNLAELRLPEYVQSLAGQIEQVFRPEEKAVGCRIDVDDIELDIEQVIPCGLLITELLSNALRHAFPEQRAGTIVVELHQQGESLCLAVRDDGIGLPADLDLVHAKTLGLQLVRALTDQLDGTLELERGPGTEFRVIFPARTR